MSGRTVVLFGVLMAFGLGFGWAGVWMRWRDRPDAGQMFGLGVMLLLLAIIISWSNAAVHGVANLVK